MIITRSWLNEWIDISKISTDKIYATLNAIGLEVDSVNKIEIPKNIVIAKVLTCKKHPDADKLNVCTVDLGNEIKQIVCGAKNVAQDQFVVVSKIGAILPNGMEIKEAKLRGLDSSGMICSSTELGLPAMEDGIMVLDDSIGKLILGKELSEYPLVNDEVIEIELTANRGDCLSIHGVALDLSVPFELDVANISLEEDDNQLGIGRALSISANEKVDSSLLYRACDRKKISSSFLIDLRLATAGLYKLTKIERLVEYATYTTGVLLRAYAHASFSKDEQKAVIKIKNQTNGLNTILGLDNQIASVVGISQNEESKVKKDDKDTKIILEANYTDPKTISTCSANKKLEADRHLYRSSRGSEPDLDFGMDYLVELLNKYSDISMYAGTQQVIQDKEEVRIPIDLHDLSDIIGQEVPKNQIIQILQRLGFEVIFKTEQSIMNVKVPQRRHDIVNIQDVCEEIVRIVGIDNINSKPLVFSEKARLNNSYNEFQKRKMYRQRAVGIGFFETMHFVFDNKDRVERYGLKSIYKKREISNPITNELNTLRASLIPNLLESVSRNVKFGKNSIKLFEVGTIFDRSRNESRYMGFVFSGLTEAEKVSNHGKPSQIDFFSFADKISKIIGHFELNASTCKDNMSSPYEYARVIQNENDIGFIGRVHLNLEKELDIRKEAKEYSSYPISTRDFSLSS